MNSNSLSSLAALISAFSALIMVYIYRKQGKGFVWTRDPKVNLIVKSLDSMYLAIEIPLINLGLGNLRFIRLKSKTIYLKTRSITNYQMDMDEAYFPPGVPIISFKAPVYNDDLPTHEGAIATQVRLHKIENSEISVDPIELQNKINKKAEEVGEVLFILKCTYKDGSWFGFGQRTTTISMYLRGFDLNFLSSARRKELNDLFD